MNFQQKICNLMAENCVTNYRLAKEIGVHASTVANWKKGNQYPNLGHLFKIANFLGCTVQELTEEENE